MSAEHQPTSSEKENDTKGLTPHELFFHELDDFARKNNGIGKMLIQGIPNSEDYDDNKENLNKLTMDQMKSLRFVVITQERADMLDEMEQFVLGDQYDQSFIMFDTSFSKDVLDGYQLFKDRFDKTESWSTKFNLLFAYTHMLKEFDVWMHDHEVGWGGEAFLKDLAEKWKIILNKSDEELGIDAKVTRPGVVCFLNKFRNSVELVDEASMSFNFE